MIDHMRSVFSWAGKWLESVKVNIGFPVLRTDGRSVGRSVGVRYVWYVITKFSGMGRFP